MSTVILAAVASLIEALVALQRANIAAQFGNQSLAVEYTITAEEIAADLRRQT